MNNAPFCGYFSFHGDFPASDITTFYDPQLREHITAAEAKPKTLEAKTVEDKTLVSPPVIAKKKRKAKIEEDVPTDSIYETADWC
jgi:hypothetical protein